MKWYEKSWVILMFLFLVFPLGVYLMFKYAHWSDTVKYTLLGTFAMYIIIFVLEVWFQLALANA